MRNNNGHIYNSIAEIPQAVLPEMHKLKSAYPWEDGRKRRPSTQFFGVAPTPPVQGVSPTAFNALAAAPAIFWYQHFSGVSIRLVLRNKFDLNLPANNRLPD
jgi:hypothetical protein